MADELHTTTIDILALVDQLVGIDGEDAVVVATDRYETTITDKAADTVRDHFRATTG
ncbi:hypothetical protein AB0J43_01410 [Nonomuraea fuscirosea]